MSHRKSVAHHNAERLLLHVIGAGGATTETNAQLATLLSITEAQVQGARRHTQDPSCPLGLMLPYRKPMGPGAASALTVVDPHAGESSLDPVEERASFVLTGTFARYTQQSTEQAWAAEQLEQMASDARGNGDKGLGRLLNRASAEVASDGYPDAKTIVALAREGVTVRS